MTHPSPRLRTTRGGRGTPSPTRRSTAFFAFEVDFDVYFIVTACPKLVAEPLLKGITESATLVLKTRPAVVIEVHKEGVSSASGSVKRNPRPSFKAAEFYQCTHLIPL